MYKILSDADEPKKRPLTQRKLAEFLLVKHGHIPSSARCTYMIQSTSPQ
ncbi:hypothetical protein [Foetidibacter luteolus]|nr:hypothetical protein [Foetidibacter luteolus]